LVHLDDKDKAVFEKYFSQTSGKTVIGRGEEGYQRMCGPDVAQSSGVCEEAEERYKDSKLVRFEHR
jgi:hypothetical protein